jgi:hypothetical protein
VAKPLPKRRPLAAPDKRASERPTDRIDKRDDRMVTMAARMARAMAALRKGATDGR